MRWAVLTHSWENSPFSVTWWINLVWDKLPDFILKLCWERAVSLSAWYNFLWILSGSMYPGNEYNGQREPSQLLLWYIGKITTISQIFESYKWKQPYCLPFNLPSYSALMSVWDSNCSTLTLGFVTMSVLLNNMGCSLKNALSSQSRMTLPRVPIGNLPENVVFDTGSSCSTSLLMTQEQRQSHEGCTSPLCPVVFGSVTRTT